MSAPIRKETNPTASSLFGAGAIQSLVGLVGWYFYGNRPDFGVLEWIITFGGLDQKSQSS